MTASVVPTEIPGIDENSLAEARALIGVELRRDDHSWNRSVTSDAARHFAWGIGDENPLFCSEEYGATTRWGTGLAPGCFLYSVDTTVVAPRLPGVTWMYAGTEWEWFQPLRHGRPLRTEVRLTDAVMKTGAKVASFIIQTGTCEFFDRETDQLLARAVGSTFRIPKARAAGGLSYEPRPIHRYTEDELARIEQAVADEQVRGALPRYWEDTAVGEEVTPVVKGPLTSTDMICWYSTGHFNRAHERAVRHRWRHPGDSFRNAETGAADDPSRGHSEATMAAEVGMPNMYDVGTQRISWANHLLTDWMGDDGFLRRMNIQVRRPNLLGDTTWVRAQVAVKHDSSERVLAGDGFYGDVDLTVSLENQRGEVTAGGTATVSLLRRPSEFEHDARTIPAQKS